MLDKILSMKILLWRKRFYPKINGNFLLSIGLRLLISFYHLLKEEPVFNKLKWHCGLEHRSQAPSQVLFVVFSSILGNVLFTVAVSSTHTAWCVLPGMPPWAGSCYRKRRISSLWVNLGQRDRGDWRKRRALAPSLWWATSAAKYVDKSRKAGE